MWSGYSEKGTGSQERGPGSFALEAPGARAAQQAGTQAVQARGGLEGGMRVPTGNVVVPDAAPDPTLQALMRLGEAVVQPELERIKTAEFVKGMSQAASGQAMVDIVNEQPWYTEIFGPGAAVQGARSYSASAKASAWMAEQMTKMPELRKQAPDAVPGYLLQSMEQFKTGDPDTDMMIQGELIKQVPQLIKLHTKEHVAWQQEHAFNERRSAWREGAAALKALHTSGTASPEDYDAMGVTFNSKLVPSIGESDESYSRAMNEFAMEMAAEGNFPALEEMRRGGVIDRLDGRARAAIQQGLERTARETVERQAPSLAGDLWRVQVDPLMTPEQRRAALVAINARAAQQSGVPESLAQLLPDRYIASVIDRGLDRQLSQAAAAEKQAAAEAAKAAKGAAARNFFSTNHNGQGQQRLQDMVDGGYTRPELDQAFGEVFNAARTVPEKVALVKQYPGQKFSRVQAWVDDLHAVASRPNTDPVAGAVSYGQLAEFAAGFRGAEHQLATYFSKDQIDEAKTFENALRLGVPPEQAFKTTRELGPVYQAAHKLPEKGTYKAALRDVVHEKYGKFFDSTGPGWLPTFGDNLPEDQVNIIYGVTSQMGRPNSMADDRQAALWQIGVAMNPANPVVEVMGKFAAINSNPAVPLPPYAQAFQAHAGEVNGVVGELVSAKLSRFEAQATGAVLMRNGTGFIVQTMKGTQPFSFLIEEDEVRKALDAKRTTTMDATKVGDPRVGPMADKVLGPGQPIKPTDISGRAAAARYQRQ